MQQHDAKAVEVEKVLGPLKDAGLVKSVRSKAGAGYMHGPATPLVVVVIDDTQPKRHLPEVQRLVSAAGIAGVHLHIQRFQHPE